jgi:uncharacterized protein with FMN-binding domain
MKTIVSVSGRAARPAGRRGLPSVLAVLVAAAAFSLPLASCATPFIAVDNPDFSKLADGSWSGSYKGSMGSASVSATVAAGSVVSIDLTAFESSPIGAPAKFMPSRVVTAQSLTVDTVSGATYSSRVILRAVQDALEKAVRP